MTANEVAELAGHGVDAAREYLEWSKQLGIVTRVTESPATYQRNQESLNWRRIQRLKAEYTADELLALLEAETEREEGFTDRFDVESPDAVSITTHPSNTEQSIEEVGRTFPHGKLSAAESRCSSECRRLGPVMPTTIGLLSDSRATV